MEGSIQVLLPPFLPKNKKEIKLKQRKDSKNVNLLGNI